MVREFRKYKSEKLGIIVIEDLLEDGTITEYYFDLSSSQKLMDYQLERIFYSLEGKAMHLLRFLD